MTGNLFTIAIALIASCASYADSNIESSEKTELSRSYVPTDYEGTYYGTSFENKDYALCVKQAGDIQKKIAEAGLEVIEAGCTSTLFKKWVVSVRYRYPHGRGIEEASIPFISMSSCEAEKNKIAEIFNYSEIKVIDLWCLKRDRQPQLRIDHIPHQRLRLENISVANGNTKEEKCMADAWQLDKHLNELGIQAIHFHCEKIFFGIDLEPSYRISFSFLNTLGRQVSQIRAEKYSNLSACQRDGLEKIEESFGNVKLDFLYIGCEKRGKVYHRTIYHLDDLLEKSQRYVGLNVPTKRDCESKLAELESLWEAQDRKAFYSFCQETGSGYYPVLYSIRKSIELSSAPGFF